MTTSTKPTWTKDDGTVRKNIFHSYLVRAGRLMVRFKSDPQESKYKKGSATHFIYFEVAGDENEYCLAVEPETVEILTKAPKNHWVTCTAYGSADEPARIELHEAEGSPVYDPDGSGEPVADAPPPLWPDEEKGPANGTKPADPGIEYDAVTVAVVATVRAVNALHDAGIEVDATPIYSTHYIQASRR